MLVWRALMLSFCIALFAAIANPASAADNTSTALWQEEAISPSQSISNSQLDTAQKQLDLSQVLLAQASLSQRSDSPQLPQNKAKKSTSDSKKTTPSVGFEQSVSLPPFERQAASAFGSAFQNEPSFVLLYEFLPERLGIKYFLSPLSASNTVPWYLRPDASNSHGRLAGWKDGNTQYTATITYLS